MNVCKRWGRLRVKFSSIKVQPRKLSISNEHENVLNIIDVGDTIPVVNKYYNEH